VRQGWAKELVDAIDRRTTPHLIVTLVPEQAGATWPSTPTARARGVVVRGDDTLGDALSAASGRLATACGVR
jgi:hypothetical protein